MLHKVIARRRESSSTPNIDGTPVTSVLGSFVSSNQQGVITSKSNNNADKSITKTINLSVLRMFHLGKEESRSN